MLANMPQQQPGLLLPLEKSGLDEFTIHSKSFHPIVETWLVEDVGGVAVIVPSSWLSLLTMLRVGPEPRV